jgi:hypothetical protein
VFHRRGRRRGACRAAQAQDAAPAPATPQLKGDWLQRDMTRQQAQQRADVMFQRLDTNKDGTLTREEADQAAAQMGGRGQRAQRLVARLFANAQSVTQAQFEAQALARFDRQDVNHDGVVTGDERQQGRAARQERGK